MLLVSKGTNSLVLVEKSEQDITAFKAIIGLNDYLISQTLIYFLLRVPIIVRFYTISYKPYYIFMYIKYTSNLHIHGF